MRSTARSAASCKQQLVGRSHGNTYRSESVRLAWPAKWMAFGFHLGLAGYGDRPLSRWEEAFIPMRLRDSLREAKRADGRPLVASEAAAAAAPAVDAARRDAALAACRRCSRASRSHWPIAWLGRRRPRLAGRAGPAVLAGLRLRPAR